MAVNSATSYCHVAATWPPSVHLRDGWSPPHPINTPFQKTQLVLKGKLRKSFLHLSRRLPGIFTFR
ncbi:hypothetical protein TanjilG_09268 [Lupinus angustifolius]|uniref:Uncharacterized protein n=1 Tax=Lupinus angustifolius TaxID=3871 RepID=A0A4P1QWV8_LUPAN|nr:hypothetical protein TanjilG_09268 [Lupinus angustifolius]